LFQEVLLPAARQNVQVTVVDNASERPVHEVLYKYRRVPNIEIVFNTENIGASGGRNTGFERTNREYCICIDDDSLISVELLERIPVWFEKLPNAGILAFRVIHGTSGEEQNKHGDSVRRVACFHGAGFAIRKEVFEKVGYWDDTVFWGGDELEYSMRVCLHHYTTIYVPDIVVMHFSMPRGGNENVKRRIMWARHYAMVLFRYLPPSTASLFAFRLSFATNSHGWRRNSRHT
jgi:GT2 family glycosyltransferase